MEPDRSARSARTKVVVPAIGVASSVACLRSLGRRGIPTIAVSEGSRPPGFRSKYCDEALTVPDPSADLSAYGAALSTLAEREDVLTILPFREEDVFVLARHREALSAHVARPWPSLETLQRAQDRLKLFEAADAAGVPAPETALLNDWTDWSRQAVIKPRYTVAAEEYLGPIPEGERPRIGSVRYVEPETPPDRSQLVAQLGHEPLVQEFVPGPREYGFFALYDHGDAVATFQHRQLRGYKYCGGPSAYRESTAIPELESAGRRLLNELNWHGVAMVEFLRDEETGTFKLMEVNPRFWSSLPFTIQAGVDMPYLCWQWAHGRPIDAQPAYHVGIAGHLLRGELLHLYSVLVEDYPLVDRPSALRTLGEITSSIIKHPRFDYLARDDLWPFVQDLRNTLVQDGDKWKELAVPDRQLPSPRQFIENVFARR